MLKKLSLSLIAGIAGIMTVLAASPMNSYKLDIGDFTKIKVSSPINVRYICNPDSAGLVVFESSPKMASIIAFSNSKQKLTVEFSTRGVHYFDAPTVTVYSNFLISAENDADSLLRLEKVAPAPELKIKLMGNGRISASDIQVNEVSATIATGRGSIVITGKCEKAALTSYSTGTIQADNLEANEVSCRIVGTGEIGCWPVKKLDISRLSLGSGVIYYRGTPLQIVNKSIKTKVEPIREEPVEE